MVCVDGVAETAKSVPFPLKETTCGLPEALSLMVTVPVRVPIVVGVKLTVIAQLALTASDVPQVLVWAKSPLATMLVIVSVAVPVLVSVIVCGTLVVPNCWLPNATLVAERVATGAVPVPVRFTN
jgi:hypothetical protein